MKIVISICCVLALTGCGEKRAPDQAVTETSKKDAKPGPEGEHAGGEKHEEVKVNAEQQKAARFEFVQAEVRSGARTVETTATVTANETRMALLRALSTGRVARVMVRSGDPVKSGQALLTYDNIELGEALGEYLRALTTVERAKTEADVAGRSVERAQSLVGLGAVARADLDRRDAERNNALAAIRSQNAELARIGLKLRRFGVTDDEIAEFAGGKGGLNRELPLTTLRAPFDGIAVKVMTSEGETVQTDTQLIQLIDTSTVWVQADVYQQDLAAIRTGSPAVVRAEAYPGESFRGRITLIADSVNPETRTTRVRVEVPNPQRRLKLDMYVTVQLPAVGERPMLAVPAVAIQQIEGRPSVFVKENDTTFVVRPVKLGPELRGYVEILDGLKAGETLVARGSFTLRSEHAKGEIGEEGHKH